MPQQRESKEYWSRNSLTVVTARVFYVVSGFFYFHPQCQGRRHLRFYVICEPRGAHPLMFTEGELTLWWFDDELWNWFRNVTFIQLCIFCFFDRKSGQYVSKHRHFTMVWYVKGISAKNLASKRAISVFFVIIHPQQKTRFRHVHLYGRPCSETSMSLFRNVLVININAMKGTKVVIIYNV